MHIVRLMNVIFLFISCIITSIIKNTCVIANRDSRKINFKYSFPTWEDKQIVSYLQHYLFPIDVSYNYRLCIYGSFKQN